MEVTGKIIALTEKISGETKAGKDWGKISFVVQTDEQYNNTYPLENFNNKVQTPKVGDFVKAEFNINANEWKGKYFVTLVCWKLEISKANPELPTESGEDTPF